MRHVLVIGGAGYVGSVLNRKLLSNGYKVRVLDNLIYENESSVNLLMEESGFSFCYGSFGDSRTLSKAMEGITDVVLLASMVGDPICKKYPELARKVNVEYPKQLFDFLAGKKIGRFVFASTCSNYGLRKDDTPAAEDSELNPQSLYAETKIEFERHILANSPKIDFEPVILRLSTAFGISGRMRFDLTISEFTRELALGKNLLVYDENTWRPYCNVADISKAIISVLEGPAKSVKGEVFNVGSDQNNYTKKMIVEIIQKHVPQPKVEYKKGGFDPRNYRVSFEKAKRVLNFNTDYTAENSVVSLLNAIKNGLFADTDARRNFYGNYEVKA